MTKCIRNSTFDYISSGFCLRCELQQSCGISIQNSLQSSAFFKTPNLVYSIVLTCERESIKIFNSNKKTPNFFKKQVLWLNPKSQKTC